MHPDIVDFSFLKFFLSFTGMFHPSNLVCSIQGIFNVVDVVDGTDEEAVKHVPSNLQADVREGNHPVRSYK